MPKVRAREVEESFPSVPFEASTTSAPALRASMAAIIPAMPEPTTKISVINESDLSMFLMRFDEELTNIFRSSKTYEIVKIAMKFQEKFENIKS